MQGVPLENDGGAGSASSHWEKLYLPNEFMNPTIESPGYFTGFTKAFFEGTGWYKISDEFAQYYDWGRDDGCAHFTPDQCPTGPEYCPSEDLNSAVCSPNYISKVRYKIKI